MDPTGGYRDYQFVSEFYDHIPGRLSLGDTPFYLDLARETGGPVLELACGTGRVLIPMARAGIEMTGLDLAEPMLERCRAKLADESAETQSRTRIVFGDMRHFDLGRSFRLVTIPARAFQYLLTVEDQMACLTCARRHLDDGGRIAIDLFDPFLPRLVDDRYLQELPIEGEFTMPDGRLVRRAERNASRDLARQMLECEIIYYVTHPDGQEERLVESFPFRYLFRFEFEHLLARCGFEVEALYSGFDRSPPGAHSPGELLAVARRTE